MLNNQYSLRKTSCPILPPTVLHREALVTKIREAITGMASPIQGHASPYKLVLICAPAGYGKTTLLADFAQSSAIACCWYFLDQSDGEQATFLRLLLTSIRHRFPHFGSALDSLMNSMMPLNAAQSEDTRRFEVVMDALIQAIENEITERFALLLCNYQEVNEYNHMNKLIDYLLHKLPSQCTLIIESRAIPSLETAPLLSRREMFGLGSTALRFSAQEIQQLAQLLGTPVLNSVEAERLTQLFDGWIAGILLGTRLGDFQFLNPEATGLPNLSTASQLTQRSFSMKLTIPEDRLQLFAALVGKIFQREPEAYSFLKDAAILEEMTPAFCNALLGIENAGEYLHYLEQHGLFVMRSGTLLQTTYTCHPILRDLLRRELASQTLERFRWLHQRAAELFRAEHNYDRAIWHAIEAHQYELVVEMILEQRRELLANGHRETLARWIDMLPVTTRSGYPLLRLLRAKIHLLCGELDQAVPILEEVSDNALSPMPGEDDTDRRTLYAEVALTRSYAAFQMGKYIQAQALSEQVLVSVPVDEIELHAEAHHILGVCANILGNISAGITHLQKSLQIWGRGRIIRETAEVHSILASSYSMVGNFSLADYHLSRAIVSWEQLQDDWGRTYNLVRMGMVKQRQGNLNEAEALLKEALGIARGPTRFQRGEAYALVSLGEVYLEQEHYDEALTHTESGLTLARQVKDKYLIHCTLCALAVIYALMGDPQTALLIISEAEPFKNDDKNSNYEQIIYELALGMIWLQQREYHKAYSYLSAVKAVATSSGLVREQIQAGIRIAVCQLGLGKRAEMRQSLDDLMPLLARGSYEHLFLTELQYLPNLKQVVMNASEYMQLRSQVGLEERAFQSQQQTQAGKGNSEQGVGATITSIESASLKVQTLGEPLVLLNEVPITRWRMARAMELCFFLLDSGHPMRKEQIITALWEEVDDHVDQTFRSTIYYLRKTLGEGFVITQSGTYTLDGTFIWYDVAAFYEHQAKSRTALAHKNPFAAREELLTMTKLYQGDYLQSCYSNWCSLRRDELRQAYLEARRELAKISWHQEWFDECTTHWQHMLVIDNCLEEAHYGLMRCYLKQGKRSLAQRQYQRCSTILREELGVAPSLATQKLYRHLVETDV